MFPESFFNKQLEVKKVDKKISRLVSVSLSLGIMMYLSCLMGADLLATSHDITQLSTIKQEKLVATIVGSIFILAIAAIAIGLSMAKHIVTHVTFLRASIVSVFALSWNLLCYCFRALNKRL